MENSIQILQKGIEFLIDTASVPTEKLHVTFCHKDQYGFFKNGVTSEGLLQMLISRYQFLVDKDPSIENKKVLYHLNQSYDTVKSRRALKQILKDEHKRNGLSVSAGS